MAKIQIKRGLQENVSNLVLAEGELAVALDTGNVYIGTTAGTTHVNPKGGTADVAAKLATAQKFSISGDGTAAEVAFDGTAAVNLVLALAAQAGLTAGTYTKLTVNGKGLVTAATQLELTDLPNIPTSKIDGLGTAATKNVGTTAADVAAGDHTHNGVYEPAGAVASLQETLGTAATKDIGTSAGNVVVVGEDGKIAAILMPDLSGTYVPVTTTINGKALSENITLSAADVGAIPTTEKGANSGVAELDASGKVPVEQLPSYVDDVVEYDSRTAFPADGEAGKIYVAKDTNLTYRWSGTGYVEISPSLALGETSSTAYRGDRGKTAYDHSQAVGNPHQTTAEQVGAVPTTRTINGKALSENVTLTATDVSAAPSSHAEVMATDAVLGHVKIGAGLLVESGVVSVGDIDGGTF